jgi:hypothetical protein
MGKQPNISNSFKWYIYAALGVAIVYALGTIFIEGFMIPPADFERSRLSNTYSENRDLSHSAKAQHEFMRLESLLEIEGRVQIVQFLVSAVMFLGFLGQSIDLLIHSRLISEEKDE